MRLWEQFTKEELEQWTKDSRSYRQLGQKIGYSMKGGSSHNEIKLMIQYHNLDISHFTGQGWNVNNFDYSRFKKGNVIKLTSALPAIVQLRGHQCEVCKNVEWNNQPIPLEIHHIDGDPLNNDLKNLQLLCPNCHSQTETWRGKNSNGRCKISEEDFVKALQENSNIRQALLSLGLSARGGNYSRARELIHKYNIVHLF